MPCTYCLNNIDISERVGGYIVYEDGTVQLVCYPESKYAGSTIIFVGTEYLSKCFDNSTTFAVDSTEDSKPLFICDSCIEKALTAGHLKQQ